MIQMPHYEMFRKNGDSFGRLLSDYTFYDTPIKGYDFDYKNQSMHCRLSPDGTLTIFKLSEWDFGTGPVIQDQNMVRASLFHDPLCYMTDSGVIPYSERVRADNYFAWLLNDGGSGVMQKVSTAWRWLVVSLNSQTIARLRRKR
jgi:hypothetical protein